MSSFALDHHVARAEPSQKAPDQWSARRRFAALAACIVGAWAVVLAPAILWL